MRWTGKLPENKIKPEDMAEIKAALPKAPGSDENARALIERTAIQMAPMLFGPGEPLLAIGVMHPDLAERRITQRIGEALNQAPEQQFGAKMTPAERHGVTEHLVRVSLSARQPSPPDPSAGPGGGKNNSSGLTPLMFIVRAPGRVISTNGERDEFAGEIYWALYPEAAMLKEVTLTALCDLDAK